MHTSRLNKPKWRIRRLSYDGIIAGGSASAAGKASETPANARAAEDSQPRITEDGQQRIIE